MRKRIPFYNQLCILLGKANINRKQKFSSQKISSPKVLNQFAPTGRVIRRNTYVESRFVNTKIQLTNEVEKHTINLEDKGKGRETFTTCSLLQAAHAPKVTNANLLMAEKKSVLWEETEIGSPGIEEETKNLQPVIIYCSCGRISQKGLGMCDECYLLDKPQEISGYLYVEKDEKNVDRYWFSLVNTDLYCKCTIEL